jgi:hypothetical protein
MLVKESLNESMGYKTIFGTEVSHEEALQKSLRDHLTEIITAERGISEKAFSDYDSVMSEVKQFCENNPEIYEMAQEFYENSRRMSLLAETLYDEYFKNESKES